MDVTPQLAFDPDTMNAPWNLDYRFKLVKLACEFFDATRLANSYARIGKKLPQGNPEPLSVADFLQYLNLTEAFPKTPNPLRVSAMVERMASAGLLMSAGQGAAFGGLKNYYLHLPVPREIRRGFFRWVPVLGAEFLYKLFALGLVHITGEYRDGGEASGTGLIVDASHVLTCGHVVSDMKVHDQQTFQGKEYSVNENSIYRHHEADIAVIRVEGPPMLPLQGLTFQAPVVTNRVYTLGYPKLPSLREASLIIQEGAVSNESVTSLDGKSLFLYSAITRPGNSGGPVISENGYVVGLSVVNATGKYHAEEAFSPHYAGIPAQVVVQAVHNLDLGIQLPFENYE